MPLQANRVSWRSQPLVGAGDEERAGCRVPCAEGWCPTSAPVRWFVTRQQLITATVDESSRSLLSSRISSGDELGCRMENGPSSGGIEHVGMSWIHRDVQLVPRPERVPAGESGDDPVLGDTHHDVGVAARVLD